MTEQALDPASVPTPVPSEEREVDPPVAQAPLPPAMGGAAARQEIPNNAAFLISGTEGEDTAEYEEWVDATLALGKIASDLIGKHVMFSHLQGAKIRYYWKRIGNKVGGQLALGATKRLGKASLEKLTLFPESGGKSVFVIFAAAALCREFELTARQFEALMFHELCHIGQNDKTLELRLVPHEFQGFVPELEIFGPWTTPLRELHNALTQMTMNFDADGTETTT